MNLMPRDVRILAFIDGYSQARGHPPRARELAQIFALKSRGNVHRILARLRHIGALKTLPKKRSLRPWRPI